MIPDREQTSARPGLGKRVAQGAAATVLAAVGVTGVGLAGTALSGPEPLDSYNAGALEVPADCGAVRPTSDPRVAPFSPHSDATRIWTGMRELAAELLPATTLTESQRGELCGWVAKAVNLNNRESMPPQSRELLEATTATASMFFDRARNTPEHQAAAQKVKALTQKMDGLQYSEDPAALRAGVVELGQAVASYRALLGNPAIDQADLKQTDPFPRQGSYVPKLERVIAAHDRFVITDFLDGETGERALLEAARDHEASVEAQQETAVAPAFLLRDADQRLDFGIYRLAVLEDPRHQILARTSEVVEPLLESSMPALQAGRELEGLLKKYDRARAEGADVSELTENIVSTAQWLDQAREEMGANWVHVDPMGEQSLSVVDHVPELAGLQDAFASPDFAPQFAAPNALELGPDSVVREDLRTTVEALTDMQETLSAKIGKASERSHEREVALRKELLGNA